MPNVKGVLQYDRQRGVVYFFDEAGICTLRIEGVPEVPDGAQIDIHLVRPGGEHHHENCGNRSGFFSGAPMDAGSICAVKLGPVPVARKAD